MAAKRTATSDLNHTNWDAEEEPEERGVFRTASKDELQKRVIRTGRRRLQPGASSTQDKANIFSGFSGFNKQAPTSFDFLSKLTNGAGGNTANGSSSAKEPTSTSGIFGSSPIANSTAIINNSPSSDTGNSTSIFGSQAPASNFGMKSTSQSNSDSKPTVFGQISQSSSSTKQMFGIPTKADSTPTPMFGTLPKNSSPVSAGSTPGFNFGIPSNSSDKPAAIFATSEFATSNSVKKFGSKETETTKNTVFSTGSTSLSGFKLPTTSTPSSMFNSGSSCASPADKKTKSGEIIKEASSEDRKTQYYSKLKGLNESVSEWIRKHVSENALCILTPIFKDYEKYLKELEEEQKIYEKSELVNEKKEAKEVGLKLPSSVGSSIFATSDKASSNKPDGFSLGSSVSTSKPFSFGSNNNTVTTTTASPFSTVNTAKTFGSNTTNSSFGSTIGSTPAPFSFGIGQPFTLNSNTIKPPEQTQENKEDEDEPPKVEFTPIAEENSVFDKRCKIFVKKDGSFVDKGVGTLYIKTIENSSKHQLIVRANTSLGTVLLNFILSDSIPIQRMGKNNVMVVCIATPDAKPPPVPVLIRVKTSEEADDLLETLNKYKQ